MRIHDRDAIGVSGKLRVSMARTNRYAPKNRRIRAMITILTLVHMLTNVLGDSGSCRYDVDRCSCKIGEANQGVCWDRDPFFTGLCNRRFCRSGWTCSCHSRTHLCFRGYRGISSVAGEDVHKTQAPCVTKSIAVVSGQDIVLGSLRIHLSRAGVLANDCTQIAWWHNGELMGSRGVVNGISLDNVDDELSAREVHSMLELRPGDLIAFRFRKSSYYCYKNLVEFTVNGTTISSVNSDVSTYYARKYSKDWYLPSKKFDQMVGVDESETDLTKFIPARTTKLSSNTAIIPGEEYWMPTDDSDADNKRSDWYFRVQLPETLK